MAPKGRNYGRGVLGILISEKLNSGYRIVEIQSSNPKAEQKLFQKIFNRMGRKVRINTDTDSLLFSDKEKS